jgi:hypothetical protein
MRHRRHLAHVATNLCAFPKGLSTVNDRVQPIRSAITVVGIVGHCANNCRICGSTASTIDPLAGR